MEGNCRVFWPKRMKQLHVPHRMAYLRVMFKFLLLFPGHTMEVPIHTLKNILEYV